MTVNHFIASSNLAAPAIVILALLLCGCATQRMTDKEGAAIAEFLKAQ